MKEEIMNRKELARVRRELLRRQRTLNRRRFFHNRQAVFGALVVTAMLLLAALAPVLAPADPLAQAVTHRFDRLPGGRLPGHPGPRRSGVSAGG